MVLEVLHLCVINAITTIKITTKTQPTEIPAIFIVLVWSVFCCSALPSVSFDGFLLELTGFFVISVGLGAIDVESLVETLDGMVDKRCVALDDVVVVTNDECGF